MPRRYYADERGSALPVLGGLLAGVTTTVVAWIGYSALIVDHHVPLPSAIDAERKQFLSREGGLLSYYVDNSAQERPLVLLHSINAAASSFEMRPLFQHFRVSRPVYALDLPGFGFSERADRPYSPRLYAQAILEFLMTQVRQPADMVALSLSGEFAAQAALQKPDAFNSLTLISPTGFAGGSARPNGLRDFLVNLIAFPLWGQAFYDLLVTPASIQYFLQQHFVGPVFPALADYSYATAHQPGARYAPLVFLSGRLFTPNIRERVYEALNIPLLVIADHDPHVRFEDRDAFVNAHANWYSSPITPSRGLPHFEHLPDTAQALDNFWAALEPLKPFEADKLAGWSAQDSE